MSGKKVFVTGATGFIGSATVPLLREAGYDVTGLARSDEGVRKLKASGIKAVKGDLTSLDVIKKAATESDGVIHLAYIHDFSIYEQALAIELRVVQAILDALKGSNKPFIAVSGAAVVGDRPDQPDESTPASDDKYAFRGQSEALVVKGKDIGVRSAVVRLPMFVYDKDGAAFSKVQDGKAHELGYAVYIGTGAHSVSVVHVQDAAKLFVQTLTYAQPGKYYHAVNGQVSTKQVAEAIAAKYGVPAKSVSPEEATEIYGDFFATFFSINNVVASEKTRKELHWEPKYGSENFLQALAGKGV